MWGAYWSTEGRALEDVLRDYERLGVRQVAEEAIAEHTTSALNCLKNMPVNEATEALCLLAQKLQSRKV